MTNGCPHFDDGARRALVVRPMKAGLSMRMAAQFSMAEGVAAIERGQDDAARFFRRALKAPPCKTASSTEDDFVGFVVSEAQRGLKLSKEAQEQGR